MVVHRVNGIFNKESIWIGQEDVVISGMSGRFPESNSIAEFETNLYNGVDMVTDDDRRGPAGLFGIPLRTGKLKDIKHFDASFFGVHPKQTESMDPQSRLLLEVAYEAIMDAGVNPITIRGSNTGVFVGVTANDSDEFWNDLDHFNAYGLTGCFPAMFANRISFAFDFRGPSYAMNAACASSGYALQQALMAIRTGQCDAAIVGGCHLLLNPMSSLQANELGMLSPEGMCKAFDESGNGFVRSEAVVALYLQKSTVAKRIYATLVHAKTSIDGAKEEGITFPSGKSQKELMQQVYKEVKINPAHVAYVEAHGTGTKAGDPQEVNSIAEVFCKGRSSPLPIGSVKSNMGHSEPASGLCSIVKVLISMEKEIIPSNLHFRNPNKAIPGFYDRRLQVVCEPLPFPGGYVAVNSLGFGGTNMHALLKSNPKQKRPSVEDGIARLVCVSGRTEDAVNSMLDKIIDAPRDNELIALLHGIHHENITGHKYRGYTILNNDPPKEISSYHEEVRPIWFVFSGIGSQWSGMGKELLKLNVFDQYIGKAAEILEKEGFDLYKTLKSDDESVIDDVFVSSLCIPIIQVALIEILKILGIEADGYLGHSIGEFGCAYVDRTLTFEQLVLSSYWRGRAIIEAQTPKGAMAAVGLTWEETIKRAPPDIAAGCHNSIDNVTVSGPVNSIHEFIKQLESEGIFAKEVPSAGMAFHTKYIADIGPRMQNYLEKIISNPKPRSSKWISSSILESYWDTPLAKSSSTEYFVNNLLSPVYFYRALQHIPQNAIVIEVAPHILFQPILKRTLSPNTTILGLLQKNHPNNLEFMLKNLGKLYNAGGQPKLDRLFQPVEFPVSKGTTMIQSMIEWDHSIEWSVADFSHIGSNKSGETIIEIDLRKDEHAFYVGHTIDGRVLFPAAGYLTLIWQTFAKHHGKTYTEFPVVIENVQFLRATILPKEGSVKFSLNILNGSGEFEICESNSVVVKGFIKSSTDMTQEAFNLSQLYVSNGLSLKSTDIYKEFSLRGYDYSGIFCGIKLFDNYGFCGKLDLNYNYVSFMDTMLQFHTLGRYMNTRELYLPTKIQKLVINPLQQKQILELKMDDKGINIFNYDDIGVIISGGVEMRGIQVSVAPRIQQKAPKLEKYVFVPFENEKNNLYFGLEEALITTLQLVAENNPEVSKLKVIEIGGNKPIELLYAPTFIEIAEYEPTFSLDYNVALTNEKMVEEAEKFQLKVVLKNIFIGPVEQNCHLAVASNIVSNEIVLTNLAATLKAGGFILCMEDSQANEIVVQKLSLSLIFKLSVKNKILYLFRKVVESPISRFISVFVDSYNWVEDVKAALSTSENIGKKVLLISEGDETNGIVGLVNCLIKEPGGINLRSIFIQSENAPKFSKNHPVYATQLNKDLVHNVYKDGVFGTYRHLPLENLQEKVLQTEHAYIRNFMRGDLTNLRWIEGPLKYYQCEKYLSSELCTVYYASLNFRDVLIASGKLPPDAFSEKLAGQDCVLGQEFSGRNSQGRRVMGIVAAGGLSTTVLANHTFLWEIPDTWTLKEASSVPVAYGTAYYALIIKGQLKTGESLLIHDGSGCVGQAAISIALNIGCIVYTSVDCNEKRTFLKMNFSQLDDENIIINCCNSSFETYIMKQTKGKGVNMVFSSLLEDNFEASIGCLAKYGRILEIGNGPVRLNNLSFGMSIKNITYHNILLDSLFDPSFSNADKKLLVKLMKKGLANGVVKPLHTTVFSEVDVEQAFRLLDIGKHIGKIVVEIRAEESPKIVKPFFKVVQALPRTYMHPDKTYILVGGSGGLGLELANWLVSRGATKIFITSQSGVTTGYETLCVKKWEQNGIEVLISTASCLTIAETEQLIKTANSLGPIGGIFNLAAVLHDALIENLTPENFIFVGKPKVTITKNLDRISRKECPQLDYFIVFSSISCGRGNAGQSNYGFANSVMERICEARQAAGFPGNAIQWGAVGDVGLFFKTIGSNDIELGGVLPQRIMSCLNTIDNLLQQPYPVIASSVLADKRKAEGEASLGGMVDAVVNILGYRDAKNLNVTSTLAELGMDSLMGTEIRQTLERNFHITLNAGEIRNLTFEKLFELQEYDRDSGSTKVTRNSTKE